MTPAEIHLCMPYASAGNCAKFAQAITDAMAEFGIDTPLRQAFFLAQIAHESASLSTTSEYASGGAYEGRVDLGNTSPGDGVKYKGHGLIQTTGKTNHFRVADYFGVPHEGIVVWLQTPEGSARSAGLFWRDHGLNQSADANDIRANTRVINGGYNGLNERDRRLAEAKAGIAKINQAPSFSDVQSGFDTTANRV